ncbi:speckle-type POZ protein-like B [Trichonephila clavata]|uniref:Speckle-type POZ protein-like B n=1 Tax=Trichonephila clavata TaxID=2740835 RepID=A0A8X6J011_TRICU|nr:speckle-type POZ protein-like B [Trichonephila clavata]
MSCNSNTESEAWVTFLWIIENYDQCWYKENIFSPVFKFDSEKEWTCQLQLSGYKNMDFVLSHSLSNPYSSFYFSSLRDDAIEYDIEILAKDNSILYTKKREQMPLKDFSWKSEANMLHECIKTEREAILYQDTLRIRYRLRWAGGKTKIPATFFARTLPSLKKRNFLWGINGFSCIEPGCEVTYKMPRVEQSNMILSIQVNKEDKIMIFIKDLDCSAEFLKFQSFISDINGSQIDCGKYEIRTKEIKGNIIYTLPFSKKYLMDHKNTLLKNDVLSLYCECSWANENFLSEVIERIDYGFTSPEFSAQSCSPNAEASQSDKMHDLKEDFHRLYAESNFSDVKLCTKTETFHAHKAILSARSPVFHAMLRTDMKEKIQGCVDVPDLEDDTVHRMLLYIYTNALEDLQWGSALNLYAAANKYEIISLRRKCSSFLKSNLCLNNVCDVLILADMHGDSDLKETAQNYTLKHEQDVYTSEEWKEFAKNNSTLAMETMLLKWNKH